MSNPFSAIGSFFKKLFGSAPTWTKKVSDGVTLCMPLTQTLLILLTGANTASSVQGVVVQVQKDLALVGKLAKDASGDADTKQHIINILGMVVANLNSLLDAGHIKNASTHDKISLTVGTIAGEVQAIMTVMQ